MHARDAKHRKLVEEASALALLSREEKDRAPSPGGVETKLLSWEQIHETLETHTLGRLLGISTQSGSSFP